MPRLLKFDYARSRERARNMIEVHGSRAILRRASGDRYCTLVVDDFTAFERLGKLTNPTDRRFLIGPDVYPAPSVEVDSLVRLDHEGNEIERFSIVAPTQPFAPDGKTVLYYEVAARK
jgi:hypothetical protein